MKKYYLSDDVWLLYDYEFSEYVRSFKFFDFDARLFLFKKEALLSTPTEQKIISRKEAFNILFKYEPKKNVVTALISAFLAKEREKNLLPSTEIVKVKR